MLDNLSEIDNEADGTESVICAVKRDFSSELSQLQLKKESKYGFYAGFNVWDDEISE